MARSFSAAATQFLSSVKSPVSGVPLTFSAWVKMTSLPASQPAAILCLSDGTPINFFGMRIESSGALDVTSSPAGNIATANHVTVGVWAHCVAVFNAANSRVAYLNGTASATDGSSQTLTAPPTQTYIGAIPFVSQFIDGIVAEAAVWNVALTVAQIAQLGTGISPLFVRNTALISYWPLYGVDSPEPDLMSFRNDLVPAGGPTSAAHVPIIRAFGLRQPPRHLDVSFTQLPWAAKFPDIILDTNIEAVASGFTPRATENQADPTLT